MKEFFSETGSSSMMRLVTFLLVITAMCISASLVVLIYQGKGTGELFTLIATLLMYAFSGKLIQKKLEKDEKEGI